MLTKEKREHGNCPVILYVGERGGKFRRYKTTRAKTLAFFVGLQREYAHVTMKASRNERTIEYSEPF